MDEYLSALGVNPGDEEDGFVLGHRMLLLHQSKNDTTLCEDREDAIVPVFRREWLKRFMPLLAMDASVLQEFVDAIDNSSDDLDCDIYDALRVAYEKWAEESNGVGRNLTEKATMRGIIRLAKHKMGERNYRRAILDRKIVRISVQPEYQYGLLESIAWDLFE